jgi:hypothetical protein
VGVSFACGVHCLLSPVLLMAAPAAGSDFTAPWVHTLLAVVVVPVALMAFWHGLRRHGRLGPTLLGGLGAAVLIRTLVNDWGDCCPTRFDLAHTLSNVAGSLLLILAHALNLYDLRCVARATAQT